MRYPASEKLEIIRLVERSHLPARRTLETLGILPSTFYRWYDRYQAGGPEALEDRSSTPRPASVTYPVAGRDDRPLSSSGSSRHRVRRAVQMAVPISPICVRCRCASGDLKPELEEFAVDA